MPDYHRDEKSLQTRSYLTEIASSTHGGWDQTENYGLIIGMAGLAETAYKATHSAGIGTLGPAIVTLGGFAIYLWANRKKEIVHQYMRYHGIGHEDLDRRF
jgi:hypothetical protein